MQKNRYPALDFLRIFACFSVILYHYQVGTRKDIDYLQFNPGSFALDWSSNFFINTWAHYGYLGVDLFFILSGSVIYKTSQGRNVGQFLRARLERLLLIYVIVAFPTYLILRFSSPLRYSSDFALSELLYSNSWNGLPLLLAVAWTLKIEILFYLIFVIIIWASEQNQNRILIILLLLQVSDWALDLGKLGYPLNFINLDGYLPYFLTGAIITGIQSSKLEISRLSVLFIYGIIFENLRKLIDLRMFGIFGQESTQSQKVLVVLISLGLLVFISKAPSWHFKHEKTANIIENIAIATYPLYLLHQQVGLYLSAIFYKNVFANSIATALIVLSFLLGISLLLIKLNRFLVQKIR
jgi:peptidoglycan/LPS O-acetylase OafA/YrhL